MKLIGSNASPYVRRIRILLGDRDYEFVKLNVMSKEGQEELSKYTDTRKVPILIDGEKTIFDSTLIAEYLLEKEISIEEKMFLKEIDEACDSGIILFQVKALEADTDHSSLFSKNHQGRIKRILDSLNSKIKDFDSDFGLKHNWLFCMLDWFAFREVYDFSSYSNLISFYIKYNNEKYVALTNPRV